MVSAGFTFPVLRIGDWISTMLFFFSAVAGKVFVDLGREARTLIKAAGSETSKNVEHR